MNPVFLLTSEFTLSKIRLLMAPILDFDGFISLNSGLDGKELLWSFIVIKALSSERQSIRSLRSK